MGIIKSHDGDMTIDSKPGEGTQVIISLPHVVPQAEPEEAIATDKKRTLPTGLRILAIDDEEDILLSIEKLFEKLDCKTVTTTKGEEALTRLSENEFDIIICDLKMPGMSGIELYERLSEEYPQALSKIIVTTGDTISEETTKFLEETDVAHIMKPVNINELVNVMSAMVSSFSLSNGSGKTTTKRRTGETHFGQQPVGAQQKPVGAPVATPQQNVLQQTKAAMKGDGDDGGNGDDSNKETPEKLIPFKEDEDKKNLTDF